MNEEVGIPVLTQMVLLRVHCTSYFVLCTTYSALLLDTSYLILNISALVSCLSLLFNVECRTPDDEGRSGGLY